MKFAIEEIIKTGKTLALIAVTIVFAAMQLDSKLERFDKKFDTMSNSVSELNHTMKDFAVRISDSDKRFIIVEKDTAANKVELVRHAKEIQALKAHTGMK